jgi:hypothetical protein
MLATIELNVALHSDFRNKLKRNYAEHFYFVLFMGVKHGFYPCEEQIDKKGSEEDIMI